MNIIWSDFYAWLWWMSETNTIFELPETGDTYTVVVDDQISFSSESGKSKFVGNVGDDARGSFAMGRRVDSLRLLLRSEEMEFEIRLADRGIESIHAKMPIEAAAGDVEGALFENILLVERVGVVLDGLFDRFLLEVAADPGDVVLRLRTLGKTSLQLGLDED